MEFRIEFYVTKDGACPVQEFLNALKQRDPDHFVVVIAGLDKLRNRAHHRPPLSKAIGDGLFELRHVGQAEHSGVVFLHGWPTDRRGSWDSQQGEGRLRCEIGRPPWRE